MRLGAALGTQQSSLKGPETLFALAPLLLLYPTFHQPLPGFLDLGAGVLILWYGGLIAMQADGSITVGALIKYQCPLS